MVRVVMDIELFKDALHIDLNALQFAAECLGILSNLNIPELNYAALLIEFDMIPWILKILSSPGN